MKHKQLDNHNYNTLESLLDRTGDFNTALSKSSKFKELDIYKQIVKSTACLDVFDGISFNHRFYFLYDNMQLEYCKKCGKPHIYFKKQQKSFRLCRHKWNYDYNA